MGFQIKDKDGQAIPINKLDEEAAGFWGKNPQEKKYAYPQNDAPESADMKTRFDALKRHANWFDIIGHCIHSQGHACSGWANVVATMIAEHIGMKFIDTSKGYAERPVKVIFFEEKNEKELCLPVETEVSIYWTLDFYKPYIELINHWQSKGYSPVKITGE